MSPIQPFGDGSKARDAQGRFVVGNPGGPGNPYAKRTAELRAALIAAVAPDDVEAVVKTLITLGKGGDVAAARLLLSYAAGRPVNAVDDEPDSGIREFLAWVRSGG